MTFVEIIEKGRPLASPHFTTSEKAFYTLQSLVEKAGVEFTEEVVKEAAEHSPDWFQGHLGFWFET